MLIPFLLVLAVAVLLSVLENIVSLAAKSLKRLLPGARL